LHTFRNFINFEVLLERAFFASHQSQFTTCPFSYLIHPTLLHRMSSETFYKTQQDLRKPESHASHAAGGNTPANSNVSAMKVTPNLLTQRQINLVTQLLTLRISPSSMSTQTRPRPSKNARPTCLCQTSLPSPATGSLQTRERSTSAPAA
jgi:hypothetical protein